MPPLLGFIVCLYIWWSLQTPAKIAGFLWLILGIVYCGFKTNFFTRQLEMDVAPVEE